MKILSSSRIFWILLVLIMPPTDEKALWDYVPMVGLYVTIVGFDYVLVDEKWLWDRCCECHLKSLGGSGGGIEDTL